MSFHLQSAAGHEYCILVEPLPSEYTLQESAKSYCKTHPVVTIVAGRVQIGMIQITITLRPY